MKDLNLLNIALLAALGFGCVTCVGIITVAAAEETPAGMPAVERMRDNAEARTEAREERREALESRVQDRVINLAHNVTTRLTAALDRMTNVASRLGSRIDKLHTLGVETTLAEARLAEAQKAIEDGRNKLKNIPSIDTAVRGDTPRESFAIIRTEFVMVRDLIRQSHTLLIDTLAILKDAVRAHESGKGVNDAVSTDNTAEGAE